MARILIIDDETNIRMMLRLALEHMGHTVEQAADGYEGLEKFGTGEGWELILLDHRMPGLEGLDVLKVIRGTNTHVPVIMVTAFGTLHLATEALQAGATDFLRKPFTIEVLQESVSAALTGKPHLPHVANAVPQSVLSFDRVGINGFRLVSVPGIEHTEDGGVSKVFSIQRADGVGRACTVVVPHTVADSLLTKQGSDAVVTEDFWEAFCGEALANYLWQNAAIPTGGKFVVEEITASLQRWADAVLTHNQGV
jgi:CheY-like chemotaxis protein